jgi:hypothetical protein
MRKRNVPQPRSAYYVAPLACAVAALAALSACGGAVGTSASPVALATAIPTSTPKSGPTATPTAAPTATPAERLYVGGYGAANNTIAYFTGPFSATSTPSATFAAATGAISGLAVDASNDVIETSASTSTIAAFARPNPTTSTLYTITSVGTPYDGAFNAGTFYVSDGNDIYSAPTPLSAASTFAPLISSGLASPWGIAFDASNNMYVVQYSSGLIAAYAPPYTGAPFATVSTGGSNLESLSYDSATNQIITVGTAAALVYSLPLTGASTPSATVASTTSYFAVGTTDQIGNLFVGTGGDTVEVFAPPFTNASTMQFAFPVASQPAALAIGR